ncbi:MAG: P-II family nitrogen regulator [Mariprofundaceae bacterium]|nr:P-II family nitrogen regulator [Mariprofundaceae bacterium]
MKFKLIIAMVEDTKTDQIMLAARQAGATGATIVSDARGEGLNPQQTFFGLNLEAQRNILMFIVEEHLSRKVLEKISDVGEFEKESGCGLAFQIDIEDAIGLGNQIHAIEGNMDKTLTS